MRGIAAQRVRGSRIWIRADPCSRPQVTAACPAESREKLPFYESLGTKEVLLIDSEMRAMELCVMRGDRLHVVLPDSEGALRSQALGVRFVPVAGPGLRVEVPEGAEEI